MRVPVPRSGAPPQSEVSAVSEAYVPQVSQTCESYMCKVTEFLQAQLTSYFNLYVQSELFTMSSGVNCCYYYYCFIYSAPIHTLSML